MAVTVRGHGQVVTVSSRSESISVKENEKFKIAVVSGVSEPTLPYYDGDYEVTPSPGEQVLETARHSMRDDVTVHAIPYHSVSNEAGGYTVSIAS